MQICADLHVHTSASDGDLSPAELVTKAQAIGLSAVAITDHDTISGVPEALRTGAERGIRVIAGVEISVEYDPGTMHILGYFKTFPDELEKRLAYVQEARRKRFPRIIERLNTLGMDITVDDVAAIANDAQIGRPHIAKALINKGYVQDFEEAFSRYLAKGKPAYVEKERMTWNDAISLIHFHGGLPVLAHPFTLDLPYHELRLLLEQLASAGLKGVETFYPEHTRAQKKRYREIARGIGLFITGGTDYHGPGRNHISLGDFGVDEETLSEMLGHFTVR